MRTGRLWAALALAGITGCSNLAPTVNTDAAPAGDVGYVAAAFSNYGTGGMGFGFGLRGPGEDVLMSFDGPLVPGMVAETRMGLVAVPPGEYSVDNWVTFNAFRKIVTKQLVDGDLSSTFTVRKGQVVFLGRFGASSSNGFKKITFRLQSERTSAADAQAWLLRVYAKFSGAPFDCVLCTGPRPAPPAAAAKPAAAAVDTPAVAQPRAPKEEPPAKAEPAAAPPPVHAKLAPRSDAVPDGGLVLHLFRPGGDYAGWGLTTWETTEAGKVKKMLAGLASPMVASGVDEFGAYWVLQAKDYGDRRVGFLLHKEKERDAAGLERAWFPPAARQVWLNSGDGEVYFSREKAIGARGR